MTFLAQRLSTGKFTGLPLTIIVTASAYFVFLYLSGVLNSTPHSAIVLFDIRVSQFLSGFRSPAVIRFFTIVTAFGNWAVVAALAVAVSFLLLLYQRSHWLIGLWIALSCNQILINVIKVIFYRKRPELAFYSETTYSFPSGHSAASVAFFGIATHILIRERIAPISLTIAGALCAILLIGTSRLVLGEHYLSDVLNGYLIGGLGVALAIWFTDYRDTVTVAPRLRPVSLWRPYATFAVFAVTAVAVWILARDYQRNLVVNAFLPTSP